MMKHFMYTAIFLTALGAALSAVLLFQFYFPDVNMGLLTCGDGLVDPCRAVSSSDFGSFLGIPLAAYGLFLYLVFLFSLLIADYANGPYTRFVRHFLILGSGAALLVDLFLGALLVIMGQFCSLCVSTYLVNLALFGLLLIWNRTEDGKEEFVQNIFRSIKEALTPSSEEYGQRAALASFLIFVFFLAFSLYSTSNIMAMKGGKQAIPEQEIAKFMEEYKNSPAEEIEFPESMMVLGPEDAEVTIVAFTDFLCSACYQFFLVEKQLLSRFKGDLRIVYYHFPLDMECNSYMSRTVYPNSCVASRAMYAAAKTGRFEKYFVEHFNRYGEVHSEYSKKLALDILNEREAEGRFQTLMESPEAQERINLHLEKAREVNSNATPTLFINGRRMVGAPPFELMERILEWELQKK